ncbi:MAG: ABC transporter ATP-binding protein [Planctomycetota bacterium]
MRVRARTLQQSQSHTQPTVSQATEYHQGGRDHIRVHPAQANPFIETRELMRHYRMGPATVRALDGVSIRVGLGEFLAVLGVSGSGKSTLLHLLGGLETPSSGQVIVSGRDLARFSARERVLYRRTAVGFVFQSYYLVPSLTALENVAAALTFQGVFGQERRRLAAAALERVGLGQRTRHRPAELSGGEQQRVAVARAIVRRPPLLLADEPTGNLDRASAAEVIALLAEIHRDLGATIVMVTHDEEMASRVADRTLHLRDGRLLEEGPSA